MITPSEGRHKRPGNILPVFFLFLFHGTLIGQSLWPGAVSAALGNSRVCIQDHWYAMQNQAGLGLIETSSLSLQHSMPYLLKELGITSLSGQFCSGTGALGFALSTLGLKGFRQSSLWLSYGLKLHSGLSAGVGIHLWNSSLPDQFIVAPGISFALGLLLHFSDQWMLGARLVHPAGWSSRTDLSGMQQGTIETGGSYTFFGTASIVAEVHIKPGARLQWTGGMEWDLNRKVRLRIGICNHPGTLSWGIGLHFPGWIADFSFQCRADTGLSPLSSLTHEW